jgi:hypothetical protein
VGNHTVYQLIPSAASIADLLYLFLSCGAPERTLCWMRVKYLANKNAMAKTCHDPGFYQILGKNFRPCIA